MSGVTSLSPLQLKVLSGLGETVHHIVQHLEDQAGVYRGDSDSGVLRELHAALPSRSSISRAFRDSSGPVTSNSPMDESSLKEFYDVVQKFVQLTKSGFDLQEDLRSLEGFGLLDHDLYLASRNYLGQFVNYCLEESSLDLGQPLEELMTTDAFKVLFAAVMGKPFDHTQAVNFRENPIYQMIHNRVVEANRINSSGTKAEQEVYNEQKSGLYKFGSMTHEDQVDPVIQSYAYLYPELFFLNSLQTYQDEGYSQQDYDLNALLVDCYEKFNGGSMLINNESKIYLQKFLQAADEFNANGNSFNSIPRNVLAESLLQDRFRDWLVNIIEGTVSALKDDNLNEQTKAERLKTDLARVFTLSTGWCCPKSLANMLVDWILNGHNTSSLDPELASKREIQAIALKFTQIIRESCARTAGSTTSHDIKNVSAIQAADLLLRMFETHYKSARSVREQLPKAHPFVNRITGSSDEPGVGGTDYQAYITVAPGGQIMQVGDASAN